MAHASNHASTRWTRGSACAVALEAADKDNVRMDIVLNGEFRSLATALTVLELLQAEGLGERRLAVEVNGEIVPRSPHGESTLRDGDRVEIVHALGGG